mmetsp:Transcript_37459/g.102929  ORF Transcript_37459/g.102929 Transcript_37459/m.102929 type:complete len:87 (+) Transcript_37459:117-377(+)
MGTATSVTIPAAPVAVPSAPVAVPAALALPSGSRSTPTPGGRKSPRLVYPPATSVCIGNWREVLPGLPFLAALDGGLGGVGAGIDG